MMNPITTHSYRCLLIEPHTPADQVELLADQGKLRTVRVRAINAGWAERAAAYLTDLTVLRADRVEEDYPADGQQPEGQQPETPAEQATPCATAAKRPRYFATTGHADCLRLAPGRRFCAVGAAA